VKLRALVLVSVALAAARPAFAQDEATESTARKESRAMFRRGVAAAEQQHWAEARDDFVRAYELFAHPSILLDLGVSRSHVGEFAQAEKDLTRFLAEDSGATPDELQTARLALGEVRKHLGTLRIRVSPAGATATVDQRPVALAGDSFTDVRLAMGPHEVAATAPGHAKWSGRVVIDAPESKVVDLALPARARGHAGAGLGAQRIGSFVLFGAGVALAGFGVFAGVHSIDLANQYNTPTEPNFQNPATKSEGIAFRTAADVTLAVAGACVAVGLVLYLTAPKHTTVALSAAGFTVRF